MKMTKKQKAFTLIEVVVAIAIIALGLVGVLAVIRRTLYLQPIIKNKVTSINLAQEGVEVIRAIRDTNWLNNEYWYYGLGDGLIVNDACVEYDSSSIEYPCLNKGLSINDNGMFVHSSNPNTPFERVVDLSYETDPEGIEYLSVTSTVSWFERNRQYSEEVKELLYDWGAE